ncbi:MAG: efflux RND transporter periplasmic adaptor subunit [Candidatus Omnitrophica bacterium]|nr:efflux RND transporter periplasmic adaptor subunit [Candidatus Omnitrophota bacterium]
MDENEIKNDAPQENAPEPQHDEGVVTYSDLKKEAAKGKKKLFSFDFVKKGNKRQLILIAIGVIIAVSLVSLGVSNIMGVLFKKKKPAKETEAVTEAVPVKVYKVKRMDFKDTLSVLGVIKGYKEVPLKFQTNGILESFNFEEGEKIQEGDIIANLQQKDALLKLKYAEVEFNTAKKLYEIGATIQDALEKSRLEYESAKSDLEKTNIYAASDGILGMQEIDVGAFVTSNDKIGIFLDTAKVYAEFDVIEKDAPKLKLGQKCEIFVDALPNKNFVGTVDAVAPLIEGRTRTERVKVELKNPEGQLKSGMFTRGLIATYEKKNTIIIPASSLKKTEEGGYVVFVVHRDEKKEVPAPAEGEKDKKGKKGKEAKPAAKDDKAKEDKSGKPGAAGEEGAAVDEEKDLGTVETRQVEVGYMTQDRVEVDKGIEENELIVMEIYQELQDKQKVDIAEVQEILY